jgi:hypothetical protein
VNEGLLLVSQDHRKRRIARRVFEVVMSMNKQGHSVVMHPSAIPSTKIMQSRIRMFRMLLGTALGKKTHRSPSSFHVIHQLLLTASFGNPSKNSEKGHWEKLPPTILNHDVPDTIFFEQYRQQVQVPEQLSKSARWKEACKEPAQKEPKANDENVSFNVFNGVQLEEISEKPEPLAPLTHSFTFQFRNQIWNFYLWDFGKHGMWLGLPTDSLEFDTFHHILQNVRRLRQQNPKRLAKSGIKKLSHDGLSVYELCHPKKNARPCGTPILKADFLRILDTSCSSEKTCISNVLDEFVTQEQHMIFFTHTFNHKEIHRLF